MTNITELHDIPAVLRTIRSHLDLTQEQLAERIGVSFASINRWEGGAIKPQKAAQETIAALAIQAGVDIMELAAEPTEAAVRVTQRRKGKGRAAVPSTKPMEQMLWDAACSIRGEKDAPKFKDYLLPLLFLKRLSDVFDDEIERLVEEYGDREIALERSPKTTTNCCASTCHRKHAGASSVAAKTMSGRSDDQGTQHVQPRDIGEHLTKAVRAVVRDITPRSQALLTSSISPPSVTASVTSTRPRLAAVVETFSDSRYRLGLADVQPDFLGRAYEYLLRKFAEGSGQSAGEFFTPDRSRVPDGAYPATEAG